MQKPEIAAKRFAIMPDENIQAFEAAMEKKCFHPTYSEYALLLPFISMGYIVSYPDDCFEAVKEARTVYKKSTPQISRLTANSWHGFWTASPQCPACTLSCQ